VLFLVFWLVNPAGMPNSGQRIVVGAGRIEQLATVFVKTRQRPPTRKELQGLIDDFVLEEVYYREALAMGIDRDDTVIRRRLRQKLEFLTDDTHAVVIPTDEELAAFLVDNQDKFRATPTYTFRQVYFNPQRHGDSSQFDVAEHLAILRTGGAHTGDASALPEVFEQSTRQGIDGTFGLGFSEALDKLTLGEWHGPVPSGLGIHLVLLEARTEGRLPGLAEIRSVVAREWSNARRLANRLNMNKRLLDGYEVAIEWPEKITPTGRLLGNGETQ
jgi:hypothetical protein